MTNHPHGSGVCEECGNCIIPDCAEHPSDERAVAVLRAAVAFVHDTREPFDGFRLPDARVLAELRRAVDALP